MATFYELEKIGEETLEETVRRLREELNDAYPNFVCEKRIPFADGEVWMLCFEKYYFRVNSNNALTVLLTKKPGKQQVFLVADGGGYGITEFDFGADKAFAKLAKIIFENIGFALVPQKSDDEDDSE